MHMIINLQTINDLVSQEFFMSSERDGKDTFYAVTSNKT
jgi:hypothetical protein